MSRWVCRFEFLGNPDGGKASRPRKAPNRPGNAGAKKAMLMVGEGRGRSGGHIATVLLGWVILAKTRSVRGSPIVHHPLPSS